MTYKILLLLCGAVMYCYGFEIPMMSFKFSIPAMERQTEFVPGLDEGGLAGGDMSGGPPGGGMFGGSPGGGMFGGSAGGGMFGGFPGLFGGLSSRLSDMMSSEPNINGPDVKTEVKNETKGNMHITTIDKKGKNFHMVQQVATMANKQNGSGASGSFSMAEGMNPLEMLLGGGEDYDKAMEEDKKKECSGSKPCPSGKFCDPLKGKCRQKLPAGSSCAMKGQCKGEGIICKWGKCNKAKPGDPGTFCQKNKDCSGDASCNMRQEVSQYVPICSPRLDIGSVCGYSSSFGGLFGRSLQDEEDADADEANNPCKKGLKCVNVGYGGSKLCVTKDLKVKTDEEEAAESNAQSDGNNSNSGNDEGSSDSSGDAEKDSQTSTQPQPNPSPNPPPGLPNLPGEASPTNPPDAKVHKSKKHKHRKS